MQVIWGRNPVNEALRGRRRVLRVYLASGVSESGIVADISERARQQNVPVQTVPRHELDRLAGSGEHQGAVAQVADYPYGDVDDILRRTRERGEIPFLLILDSLQDPQNFGSLLRTAEAVGVDGVIIPKRRAVGVTPAVVKASAGAVEHLEVAQVSNLVQMIESLKREGLWVVGVEAGGQQLYDQTDLTGPIAIVVGSEGAGLGRLVRESCDFLIRLPMQGRVTSLNAAVAGSIVLYEVWRQRRAKSEGRRAKGLELEVAPLEDDDGHGKRCHAVDD